MLHMCVPKIQNLCSYQDYLPQFMESPFFTMLSEKLCFTSIHLPEYLQPHIYYVLQLKFNFSNISELADCHASATYNQLYD